MKELFEVQCGEIQHKGVDDRVYVSYDVQYLGESFTSGNLCFRARCIDSVWSPDTRLHKEILRLSRSLLAECNNRHLYFKTQAIQSVCNRLESTVREKIVNLSI